ncbi:MAG: sigma-70 family RNA polymerase sigma factor [Spirochaetes bacterium]|nr:sigma-70 family RNA polymerase sigma factor [Spirochaetota bacterium]
MSHDNGFETFFKRHQNIVYRVILGYVRECETAEDLTVEAFMKVFERWDRVRTMKSPEGYLVRTGINCAKTFLRGQRRQCDVAVTGRESGGKRDSPELLFFRNEKRREIEKALLGITQRERNVIIMKDMGGRTLAEISHMLGIKLPTVKSLYRRGKKKLVRKLGFSNET